MDKFLIGAGIGVAAVIAFQKLNQQCWSSGGSLLNSGNPVCTATQSVIPLFAAGAVVGYLAGGPAGAFGAVAGEAGFSLYGLSKVAI
jgi:hypothetical protein